MCKSCLTIIELELEWVVVAEGPRLVQFAVPGPAEARGLVDILHQKALRIFTVLGHIFPQSVNGYGSP